MKKVIFIVGLFIICCNATFAQWTAYEVREIRTEPDYDAFLEKCQCTNEKWGFCNGKEVTIPCKYDAVEKFDCIYLEGTYNGAKKHYARVKLNGKWGIIDGQGNMVLPCQYSSIGKMYHNTTNLEVAKDNLWGTVDVRNNFKIVIPFQYDELNIFGDGKTASIRLNGKNGYIDSIGNVIVPCKWDEIRNSEDGFFSVKLDGKWGYISTPDKLIVGCRYDTPIEFSKSDKIPHITVKLNGKIGWLDTAFQEIIPCEYDRIEIVKFADNEYFQTERNRKYGLLNNAFQIIIDCQYDKITDVGQYFQTYSDRRYGLYSKNGEEILSTEYEGILFMDNENNTSSSKIDEKHNSFIQVKKEKQYGLLDINANELFSCQFSSIGKFDNNGFTQVHVNGLIGLYDKTGKIIIPCQFKNIYASSEKTYSVMSAENRYGIFDNSGKVVIPCIYEIVMPMDNGNFFIVRENFKSGLYDNNGKEIIPIKYQGIQISNDVIRCMLEDGSSEDFDKTGKKVKNK
jgi:hypothetical protein